MTQPQTDRTQARANDQASEPRTQAQAGGSQSTLRVLVVGGAGHVGGIIRESLEARHTVTYFDLNPVPGAENRTRVGSVTDEDAVAEAVADVEAVVYLAMGRATEKPAADGKPDGLQSMFDVNTQGVYRVLRQALKAGVRRFIYASSLSVYARLGRPSVVDESDEPDAFHSGYGLTKRLGERVCEMAGMNHPDAIIVGLRLIHPLSDSQHVDYLANLEAHRRRGTWFAALAPGDTRRLFLAALALDKPGVHMLQTSGDLSGERYPNDTARALLGWEPEGK